MTWQEAVRTVLDMADQNIGELEHLAHDEREHQHAASLRTGLESVRSLVAAAPRMFTTLRRLRALLATPDFVETIDTGIVAEWVETIDEVIRDARGPDELHPSRPVSCPTCGETFTDDWTAGTPCPACSQERRGILREHTAETCPNCADRERGP